MNYEFGNYGLFRLVMRYQGIYQTYGDALFDHVMTSDQHRERLVTLI